MKNNEGLIFIHIPKTAGVTMHSIITRQYARYKHYRVQNIPTMKLFLDLSEEKRHEHTVIRGHLNISLADYAKPGLPIISFLRQPFKRVVSGYEFIRRSPNHKFYKQMMENNYSLYNFLDGKYINNYDNGQVRFLCGDHETPFGELTTGHLQKAKNNLDNRLCAFGITEKFDESVLHFANVLGWNTPLYRKMNVARRYGTVINDLDQQTISKINECNVLDNELYEYALSRFNDIIKNYGPEFEKELQVFRYKNEHKGLWFRITDMYYKLKIVHL